MATAVLSQVQENCPRDFEFIKNTLSTKTQQDTFYDMVQNKVSYSFYATPLVNGVLPRSDVIVGFVVDKPTTFTFSIGKNITLTKTLNEGDFQYAFYDNAYPCITAQFENLSISELNGSGYIIHAELNSEPRRTLTESTFELGDYTFMSGIVAPKEWMNSSEGKRLTEMSNLPKSPTGLLDYLRNQPSYISNLKVKAVIDACKTDDEFLDRIVV